MAKKVADFEKPTISLDYISFDLAKLLKELGFNETCDAIYRDDGRIISKEENDTIPLTNSWLTKYNESNKPYAKFKYHQCICTAPTIPLVLKWLRVKFNIIISVCRGTEGSYLVRIDTYNKEYNVYKFNWICEVVAIQDNVNSSELKHFSTYDDAINEALDVTITFISN